MQKNNEEIKATFNDEATVEEVNKIVVIFNEYQS